MTKQRWRGSLNTFSKHIDPEKEEQVKWVKIGKQPETLQFHRRIWDTALKPNRMQFKACLLAQCYPERGFLWYTEWQLIRKIEDQVKKILMIIKNINHGNKERNLRKKSEAIQLIEDFHKQYESLYSLYVDLREEVKKNTGHRGDDSSPTSESESESYCSTAELKARKSRASSGSLKVSDSDKQESETSDLEDTILKDKLTCSSEVKKIMNPEPESAFSNPPEFQEVFKEMRIQAEESENTSQMLARVKDLEGQVATLKREVSTLRTQKRHLEEQAEYKSYEAMQAEEKISGLEADILEMEATSKAKECQLDTLRKQLVDDERHYSSRKSELVAQANDMQLELNTLKHQKGEFERRLSRETEQWSSQVKDLMGRVSSLQHEVVTVNSQNNELKLELEKKSEERSECLIQIEVLRHELNLSEQRTAQEKKSLKVQMNDLELKIKSLSSKKSGLEEQVKKIKDEALQSSVEKEKLRGQISELQTALSKRENELSIERMKFNDCQTIMSVKIKSLAEGIEHLKSKLESSQHEREGLQAELKALQNDKKLLQMELDREREKSSLSKSQLEKISKTNFQLVEKKVEEMAEQLRKQYDDQYRLLSRRIRVAEQLQVENREWYRRARETYEQEMKDLKEKAERTAVGSENVKELAATANDLLTSLDSQAIKFEERAANLVNRISKASCELKFAKDWAKRKNKALLHVKDDVDCILAQLDDKEAEILAFREKVWKSEHKVRELEKMIKEKEDGMLALNEEKREAIRQLCVWIDYHRGRSDFYKKMLSEMNTARRKAS